MDVLRSALSFNASSPLAVADEVLPVRKPEDLVVPSGKLVRNEDKGCNVTIDLNEYVTDIQHSHVYDVAIESPLQPMALLSEKKESSENKFWLKRDDLQSVHSFKLRGAYNMISQLTDDERKKGLVTASAGNHAQGVALSACKLDCQATIVMPEVTPQIKIDAVARIGGKHVDIIKYGESFDESQERALELVKEKGYIYIPPFDNVDIIKGQGTIAPEVVRQMPRGVEAIFVPIGGGGLVSGIVVYFAALLPGVKIIGVEAAGANGMAQSFNERQRIALSYVDEFADGVAVKVVGKETYNICKQLLDGVVVVGKPEICAAIKDVYEENRNILEPAGALALAGAKAYCIYNGVQQKNVIAVASGANMDFKTLGDVAQNAGVGNDEEAIMATYLPEKPGSLKQFLEHVRPLDINELKYRYNPDKQKALLQYSVGYRSKEELHAMMERLESSHLQTMNLSKHELVLDHLRNLVGGQSDIEKELLCKFVLPEKPGALLKVMDALCPRWNISLLHYRTRGSLLGNVLVGIQVSDSEINEFENRAKNLGYDYKVYVKHEPLRFLMG